MFYETCKYYNYPSKNKIIMLKEGKKVQECDVVSCKAIV